VRYVTYVHSLAVLIALVLLGASAAADDSSVPLPVLPDDDFGPVLLIEAINIRGNTSTQSEIIHRALPFAPGDVLHATDKRLRTARYKVLALGFFRDVKFAMRKGSERGNVIVDVDVVERGTFVMNKLWYGTTPLSPYWLGVDVAERNLFGLGISIGGALIYAANDDDVQGSRDQWAAELRLSDGSLRGSRWGAHGALTLVHGSESYRVQGDDDDDGGANFRAFPYRRFGGRFGASYDLTALTRLAFGVRIESIDSDLPAAPTRMLSDGRIAGIDLHLKPGDTKVTAVGLSLDRDTRSDPILPHAGARIAAAFELGSSSLGGDYDFATLFARYERWWPFGNSERHALGLRLAGGVVIGDAPRFDRIYISDITTMLTPRPLGLVLSNASPIDFLRTRDEKPVYGEVGGIASIEYVTKLFRGFGARKRVYGGDYFVGFGVWGLAETDDYLRDRAFVSSLPIDLYINTGLRVDTDLGRFEFSIANALGRLR
jgi:outer membrane protein insertion porin family